VVPCNDKDFRGGHIKNCESYGVNQTAGSRNRYRRLVSRENTGYGFHIGAGDDNDLIECHAYDKRGTQLQT
jgi:hypothetical protein